MKTPINRRKFIKLTGAAGLGLGVMGSSAAVLGNSKPNETINVAIMGTNGRGRALARGFARHPDVEITYICDVDDDAITLGLEAVKEGGQSREPQGVKDFRNSLEDQLLDALVIAGPIHWHAPASILALQAGKHVYVEKPCSHTPHEGELLVEAAARYNRTVQMGNQRRSWPYIIEGMERLKEGIIGNVYFSKCWYASSRGSIGQGNPAPVPSNLDYDLWQGPAPRKDYKDNLIHYNWHWHWHWGAGELLNNGVHFLDLARWGLDVNFPEKVVSSGGRYHYDDDQETPDTQIVTYDYPQDKTVMWEARSCNPRRIEGSATGVSFHGTDGTLLIDGNRYRAYDNNHNEIENSDDHASDSDFNIDRDHIANFVECIKSGDEPVSHIADANVSVHICHLGNIAHRSKTAVHCDPGTGLIIDNDKAMNYWTKEYEPGWEPSV